MEELLRCPFCGGEATIGDGENGRNYWVLCDKCHAETDFYCTKQEAIAAWNRRANNGD